MSVQRDRGRSRTMHRFRTLPDQANTLLRRVYLSGLAAKDKVGSLAIALL